MNRDDYQNIVQRYADKAEKILKVNNNGNCLLPYDLIREIADERIQNVIFNTYGCNTSEVSEDDLYECDQEIRDEIEEYVLNEQSNFLEFMQRENSKKKHSKGR